MNIAYLQLLSTVATSIAQLARNPQINAGGGENETLNRVGDVLDVFGDLVKSGEAARTELEQLNAHVLDLKTTGASMSQQERAEWKRRSDDAHERLQALKGDPQAETAGVSFAPGSPEAIRVAGQQAAAAFKPNQRAAQQALAAANARPNPTLPGAAEVIRKNR